MKVYVSALILIFFALSAYGQKKPQAPKAQRPEAPYLHVIAARCKDLEKLGRVAPKFDCAMLIGQYGWHGNGSGYFGTYSFYQPAFEQAKRGWWGFHGTVIEGNSELWIGENSVTSWCGGSSSGGTITFQNCGHDPYKIKFDPSVIGRTVSTMTMSYVTKEGKLTFEEFSAKVVAIIDDGANLKLDKRAPHHAEQWGMSIAPEDYVDMCDCTNNFNPLVDVRPMVTQ